MILLMLFLLPHFNVSGDEQLKEANRLIKEKSPYLLQHAYNPVDWYPWGKEAFKKAEEEDKPIFLSIGYSTCHWCHIMERESFSDKKTAGILNKNFISIKVDREERPDIDNVYMNAVTTMTGSGGWPLTVFLTPEGKPFYGGTYFPVKDTWGLPGLQGLLLSVKDAWENKREDLVASSNALLETIAGREKESSGSGAEILNKELLAAAYKRLLTRVDNRYGGIGEAPKFPMSYFVSFLLRYWKETQDEEALRIAEKTLSEIAKGGITDQLAGGVHRYSTDRQWRIPHFEKMLYDQAILARAYTEIYQVTGKKEYAENAKDIYEYVLRDMRSPEGPFYSAEDADSVPEGKEEKEEGAYYLWKREEIIRILGEEKGKTFCYYFGIEENGNAADDPRGEFDGKNVLYIAQDIGLTAAHFNKSEGHVEKTLEGSKKILFQERAKRTGPYKDDKVLTDWNALMISSLAFGGRVLGEDGYIEAAEKAAIFILDNLLTTEDGTIRHRWREGEPAVMGMIEDYAFFIQALMDLYEATFEVRYLTEAKLLTDKMLEKFWDTAEGGFFFTSSDAEKLISRNKEAYDGALPSGNSVAALDLARMARFTMDENYKKKAKDIFKAFSGYLSRSPENYLQMFIAFDFILSPNQEIVISQGKDENQLSVFLDTIYGYFLPNKTMIMRPIDRKNRESIDAASPFITGLDPVENKTTVYICNNYSCDLPVTDTGKLKSLLEKM